jgi:hypothetical protein
MYKYRRDVQRLILMDKEETKAINLFNASLAQVKNSNMQLLKTTYVKKYDLSCYMIGTGIFFDIIAN